MPTPDAASRAQERARSRSRAALMVAPGVDDVGSGLFLLLVVLCVTRVVALPLAQVGLLLTAGTVVGLAAPLVAGRLVDRAGARVVVIASQLLQATAAGTALLAGLAGASLGRGRRAAPRCCRARDRCSPHSPHHRPGARRRSPRRADPPGRRPAAFLAAAAVLPSGHARSATVGRRGALRR